MFGQRNGASSIEESGDMAEIMRLSQRLIGQQVIQLVKDFRRSTSGLKDTKRNSHVQRSISLSKRSQNSPIRAAGVRNRTLRRNGLQPNSDGFDPKSDGL